jgi:hypothetical protein
MGNFIVDVLASKWLTAEGFESSTALASPPVGECEEVYRVTAAQIV